MTVLPYRNLTTGALRIFISVEGEDLTDFAPVDLPAGFDPRIHRWDADASAFTVDWRAVEAELHAKIDGEAGAVRMRFITDIPGQQVTYSMKEAEANRWVPGVSSLLDFPYLSAEAQAKNISVDQLVAVVQAYSAQWHQLNALIEATRTAAKDAVLGAETLAAKEAAATIDWEALLAQGAGS